MMDLEILKLHEQDEVKSMHSVDDFDALQALNRGIQGKNHILENAKVKEQQRYVLVKQEQGFKSSSQQAHRVERPVDSMNSAPTAAQISEFVYIVFNQVDDHRKREVRILYDKYKRNEFTRDGFLKQMTNVVGDLTINLAIKQLPSRQEIMGIKAPEFQNHSRESSPSAEMTDPKFKGPTSVNRPRKVQGAPISHFQNNSSLHIYSAPQKGSASKEKTVVYVKQEQLDQILDQAQKPRYVGDQAVSNVPIKQNNGMPKRSNDGLERQSSKMIFPPSSTNKSFVFPSTTTQLDFSTMVNLPGPSGTIPAGADVLVAAKMPSIGQKKPLEVLGSSLPPSRKKQKVCPDSSNQSIAQLNDVTAGINLEEEENLLFSKPKKDGHVFEASRRIVHKEEERTILQKIPLQRKLAEIMAKSGLKHVGNDVERCLSLCVEERMHGLLSNIIRVSKQRTDVEKSRNRTVITSDIRKQISEMNQKMKEELERKQAEEQELKNDNENEDNCSKKEKRDRKEAEAKEERDKMRAKAANVAAHAAIGGNNPFLKWKLMAEARQKQSPVTGKNSKIPCAETGGRRLGKKQGSPKVVRSILVKDVINVVEKEPQMSKSMLLYRLYNRIGSDVQT